MSRRYNKELALESGSPLGIAPRSDYSRFVKRDTSTGRFIDQDLRVVGNDLRRSAETVYKKYIVKDGKRVDAPRGTVFALTLPKEGFDAAGTPKSSSTNFDKYARLYWQTKR
ncbi:hypothetical protein FML35_18925 [Klebsiella oxytoca]|uniref:Uncharacterized protein n=1 Tax=Klebsiella oxytoca TaxID=571 RepID=A0AAI9DX41_KLEOX|nr:hypothetical protein [Klebsiella oxytoca]ELM5279754.1 hypothetical protein [Klebsiella oxytoca]MBZ7278783.1 hypothetical protein [Klebsiella oxytoca]MBZ7717210.1 hypothetical protein [Klebsiella oxytoca]MCW9654026.1 hypothetical protein [Klebsiella oxytoca]HBV6755421.1 hypothetical protein [Klebsiella oxytoca]